MRTLLGIGAFGGMWLGVLVGLGILGETLAPVHPEITARRALIERSAADITALSLGSSHARAIDFPSMEIEGFHLSRSSGDIHEAAFLLEEMLPRLPALRCVLLPLSPFLLTLDNGAPTTRDRSALRRELYVRTGSLRYIDGDLRPFVAGKLAPVARPDHWRGVINRFRGFPPGGTVEPDGAIPHPDQLRTISRDSLRVHGAAAARLHHELSMESLSLRPDVRSRSIRALGTVIEQAGERGVHVFLYTPPYHAAYLVALPDDAMRRERSLGSNLSRRYAHVSYVDYAAHPAFTNEDRYFHNSDHLNRYGATDFSRMLARPGGVADPAICGSGPVESRARPTGVASSGGDRG